MAKLENLPFEYQGLTTEQVLERADAMARRYQLRIEAQLNTIQRLLDGSIDREEISRLHQELANARAAAYGLADAVEHMSWTQYEDVNGVRSSHRSNITNPKRQRPVVEVYGPWAEYN